MTDTPRTDAWLLSIKCGESVNALDHARALEREVAHWSTEAGNIANKLADALRENAKLREARDEAVSLWADMTKCAEELTDKRNAAFALLEEAVGEIEGVEVEYGERGDERLSWRIREILSSHGYKPLQTGHSEPPEIGRFSAGWICTCEERNDLYAEFCKGCGGSFKAMQQQINQVSSEKP